MQDSQTKFWRHILLGDWQDTKFWGFVVGPALQTSYTKLTQQITEPAWVYVLDAAYPFWSADQDSESWSAHIYEVGCSRDDSSRGYAQEFRLRQPIRFASQ